MVRKIFLIGEMNYKISVKILFYICLLPIVLNAYLSSKILYGVINYYNDYSLSSAMSIAGVIDTFVSNIQNKDKISMFGLNDIGNIYVFIIIFLIYLLVSITIWKMFIEIIYKLLSFLENNNIQK